MVKVPIYNPSGEYVKSFEIELNEIAPAVNFALIHRAVVAYQANQRQGTAKTKERAEIAKSTRKPWRQKGTGRARAGSRRSPLWRGGGTIFGPRPRDYSHHLSVKTRRNACASALRAKIEDGELSLIEALDIDPPKTKIIARLLKNIGLKDSLLIGTESQDPLVWRCARNIKGVQVLPVDQWNAYHLVRYHCTLLTPAALDRLTDRIVGAGTKEAER
ncbi:MAG: 50S ribosomal protein L4 [Planctomycetota bacterium]|jgi:large subunit ribosomal protein L4